MKIFQVIFVLLLFVSCSNVNNKLIFKNENINKEVSDEINDINKKIFDNILNQNTDSIYALFSDSLKTVYDEYEMKVFIQDLSEFVLNSNYKIIDEYYIKNTHTNVLNNISSKGYTLDFVSNGLETYVTLLETKINNITDVAFLIVYNKVKSKWKIDVFRYNSYKFNGKYYKYYYNNAKSMYENNELIPSFKNIVIAENIKSPGINIFIPKGNEDIVLLREKIYSDIKEKINLPLTISEIRTSPKVFNISSEVYKDGNLYLVIYYETKTEIFSNNEEKIRRECIEIENYFKSLFEGIDKEYFLVKAFSRIPRQGSSNINIQTYSYRNK